MPRQRHECEKEMERRNRVKEGKRGKIIKVEREGEIEKEGERGRNEKFIAELAREREGDGKRASEIEIENIMENSEI